MTDNVWLLLYAFHLPQFQDKSYFQPLVLFEVVPVLTTLYICIRGQLLGEILCISQYAFLLPVWNKKYHPKSNDPKLLFRFERQVYFQPFSRSHRFLEILHLPQDQQIKLCRSSNLPEPFGSIRPQNLCQVNNLQYVAPPRYRDGTGKASSSVQPSQY